MVLCLLLLSLSGIEKIEMGAIDSLITIVVLLIGVKYFLPQALEALNMSHAPPSDRNPKQKSTRNLGPNIGGNWDCITHKERLQVISQSATITGTVMSIRNGPHYAPDGDMVFALKPDPQYANMVNASNKTNYGGGIWCEAVCQKANKAPETKHEGDCKCSPTKFTLPKVGQRLRVTGSHVKDVGEEGHMEIHPVSGIQVIG
jgi:hypothetical protein